MITPWLVSASILAAFAAGPVFNWFAFGRINLGPHVAHNWRSHADARWRGLLGQVADLLRIPRRPLLSRRAAALGFHVALFHHCHGVGAAVRELLFHLMAAMRDGLFGLAQICAGQGEGFFVFVVSHLNALYSLFFIEIPTLFN